MKKYLVRLYNASGELVKVYENGKTITTIEAENENEAVKKLLDIIKIFSGDTIKIEKIEE